MSSSRQNTFNSTEEGVVSPLDIMTLDDPDVLFDRLESSARDFTTWLRMLQSSLDEILVPTAQVEPIDPEEAEVMGMPSMHV